MVLPPAGGAGPVLGSWFPEAREVVARAVEPPGWTLATAESCTGGLLGAALTAVPGSSRAFLGGVVAYSDSVKRSILGVPPDLLEMWGAVSEPVAAAMAERVRLLLGADLGIGVTGVAGPGASEEKPAGLVFVAVASRRETGTRRLDEDLGRELNRAQAVREALRMALAELSQLTGAR